MPGGKLDPTNRRAVHSRIVRRNEAIRRPPKVFCPPKPLARELSEGKRANNWVPGPTGRESKRRKTSSIGFSENAPNFEAVCKSKKKNISFEETGGKKLRMIIGGLTMIYPIHRKPRVSLQFCPRRDRLDPSHMAEKEPPISENLQSARSPGGFQKTSRPTMGPPFVWPFFFAELAVPPRPRPVSGPKSLFNRHAPSRKRSPPRAGRNQSLGQDVVFCWFLRWQRPYQLFPRAPSPVFCRKTRSAFPWAPTTTLHELCNQTSPRGAAPFGAPLQNPYGPAPWAPFPPSRGNNQAAIPVFFFRRRCVRGRKLLGLFAFCCSLWKRSCSPTRTWRSPYCSAPKAVR